MIGDILGGIFGGLWGYVATAAGAILVVAAAWLKGASGARTKMRAKAAEDAAKRSEKGRKAATKARDRIAGGESPEEIARGNGGKW